MVKTSAEALGYKNITSSTSVASGPGKMVGIFVASASATPTIKVWDALTGTSPVIVNTFTPVSATYYKIPVQFKTGLFVTISGTVDCTVFFENH